ncbi:MAG: hypothetical protein OIN86_14665 [Candidatus Methanoperedens sp.]|nr:hypothetical protein [Candidatus Methanoperedens sp.]
MQKRRYYHVCQTGGAFSVFFKFFIDHLLVSHINNCLKIFHVLRGEYRNAFDSLMNKARQHTSSCTVAPLLDPMDAVFLSILVEQQKEINSLLETLSNEGRTII